MDADSEDRQRDLISRREKRWSMNSQRLEQIVAELMRPIGDLRRSFDTDLCALLEEYLTEAGLHALEEELPGSQLVAPNFAELALLLQQSANIYGRKVDLLYQHVLECSESLHTNTETHDTSNADEAEAESPTAATPNRRKRRASVAGWARINLEASEQARREADLKAPPTLPRMYIELEPRVLAPCDVPLLDYAGEPVGLLQDFNVTWRLHGGLLVDELECGEEDTASLALRAIPLSELQAAIAAAAPPSPPPPPASPEPPDHHHHPPCSTPIPPGTIPLSELQAAIAAAAPPSPPPPPASPEPPDHHHHPPCSTPIPPGTIPLSELQAAIAAAAPPSPPPPLASPEPPDHHHHPPCSTPIPPGTIPLSELQAAIAAAAPPSPPPPPASPEPPDHHHHPPCSTPIPPGTIPLSELQAAIAAAAPPSPPPPPASPEPPDHHHHPPCSTPIPPGTIPLSELQAAIAAAAPPSPPPPLASPEPPDHHHHHPPCSTPIPPGTIPLSELQAAIAAAAPPSPPPPPASPEPPDHHHHPPCSTPIPPEEPAPAAPTEPPADTTKAEPATPAKQRKRKQEGPSLFQTGAGKIFLTPELRVFLTEQREFSLSGEMVSRVVALRAARILAARAQLKEQEVTEFRGFDEVDKSDLMDIGGFLGFTATTESEATDFSLCLSRLASAAESDDDGFFEQSTFSGSEGARPELTPPPPTPPLPPPPPVDYSAQPEWMSWRADVVARASAGEARGLDVRALGAAVLAALPGVGVGVGSKGPPADFGTVLDAAAKDDADVSRLFLATLFLANAGNVEVVQPPPLSLNSFSLRLVSRDERLYSAAADSDPAFLTR